MLCPKCNGTGFVTKECHYCNGTGVDPWFSTSTKEELCSICDGKGYNTNCYCFKCMASGYIDEEDKWAF